MKPKVLIVDDEPGIIEVIETYIETSGIPVDVVSATNVDDALEMVTQHKPVVIFSDISMPVKTGLDFLRELRAKRIMTPVLVVSGYGDKEMISQAWKLGAFDFLDKPINAKRLIENLKIAMEIGGEFNTERIEKAPAVSVTLDSATYAKVAATAKAENLKVEDWIVKLVTASVKK